MDNKVANVVALRRLVVRSPRLELRLCSLDELEQLGQVALDGVHDASFVPFFVDWANGSAADIVNGVVRWNLRNLAEWSADNWKFNFGVFREGQVLGVQNLNAERFGVKRVVGSGSWLGRQHQGQGVGKEMRAAVLAFAFEFLGAEVAVSGARQGNQSSLGVSRALGYEQNGFMREAFGDVADVAVNLSLSRERWFNPRPSDFRVPVVVEGFDACRRDFGLDHDEAVHVGPGPVVGGAEDDAIVL